MKLPMLISHIVSSAYSLIGAERISLYLVDFVKNELWVAVSKVCGPADGQGVVVPSVFRIFVPLFIFFSCYHFLCFINRRVDAVVEARTRRVCEFPLDRAWRVRSRRQEKSLTSEVSRGRDDDSRPGCSSAVFEGIGDLVLTHSHPLQR